MSDRTPRPTEHYALPAFVRSSASGTRRVTRPLRAYSRFAHSMRVTLPLVACMITLMVIAWPQLSEKPERFSVGISRVTANDSGGQQIVNARFTGTDREQRPYTVTADTAAQAETAANIVDLSFPKADITLRNGAWMALSAETGLYDRQAQMLNLRGAVNLFHDTGYELHTSAARIDLTRGTASGDEPVSGHGPLGTLRSRGFRMLDHGKRLIFSGKSRLILFPAASEGEGKG